MIVLTRYLPRSAGACARAVPADANSAAAKINPRTNIVLSPAERTRPPHRGRLVHLSYSGSNVMRVTPSPLRWAATHSGRRRPLEPRVGPPRRVVEEVPEAVLVLARRGLAGRAAGEAVVCALDVDQLL